MMKRLLVIAPHPDDEINLAGQFIIRCIKLKMDIFVVYTTNGDAERKVGNKRIKEAIEALRILGVAESHIIILGYPNGWSGSMHIYNADADSVLISQSGKCKTNSLSEHPEFCFSLYGIHKDFTRQNMIDDFKKVICMILPDIIICPEFDAHPDHRATSLIFDEVMESILKGNFGYRPYVLKKYIHEGVWYGKKDYYSMQPTMTSGQRYYSGGMHDLDSPIFKWNERISYATESETKTSLLRNNIIYKAARKHKLTTAWYEMQRVINSDMVYWHRPTDNLALTAVISGSSGKYQFVNDFKIYDTNNVYEKKEPFMCSDRFCWIPEIEDEQKTLVIEFGKLCVIRCFRIYEDCNIENHIISLKISTKFGFSIDVEPNQDGSCTEIILDNELITEQVVVSIINWVGKPGISEIEIYEIEPKAVGVLPIPLYEESKLAYGMSYRQKIEYISFMIRFLFKFKLKYESKKILGKIKISK